MNDQLPADFVVEDAQSMRALGAMVATWVAAGDVVVLSGPLGAGKTTWVQGFAEGLGVRGPITSPTFVIARSHPSVVDGPALVHVDAYRLNAAIEFEDLGLDADLDRSVVVVEWGDDVAEVLSDDRLVVRIERCEVSEVTAADGAVGPRSVRVVGYGTRWVEPS